METLLLSIVITAAVIRLSPWIYREFISEEGVRGKIAWFGSDSFMVLLFTAFFVGMTILAFTSECFTNP